MFLVLFWFTYTIDLVSNVHVFVYNTPLSVDIFLLLLTLID